MNDEILNKLFEAYQRDPAGRIALPIDALEQEEIFATLRIVLRHTTLTAPSRLVSAYQEFAWAIARQEGQWQHQALAYWCVGIALFNQNPRSAEEHLARALALYQAHDDLDHEARVLVGLGPLRGQMGQDEQAEADLQRAKSLLPADYHDWSALYLNLSDLFRRQGKYTESLEHAYEAAQRAREAGQIDCQIQALINQAWTSIHMGHIIEAEQMLRAAQELETVSPSAELAGRIMLTFAHLALAKGQAFDALQSLRQAEQHFITAELDFEQATVNLEEASVFDRLNLMSEAQNAARLAAEAFTQAEVLDESVEARYLAARYALESEQFQRAKKELQEAFALLDSKDSFWHARLKGYEAHPHLQRTTEQRKQALKHADQIRLLLRERNDIEFCLEIDLIAAKLAAQLKRSDSTQRYRDIMTDAQNSTLSSIEQRACTELASLLAPSAAQSLLRHAADLAARERQSMRSEELKSHMLSGSHHLYAQLIEVLLQVGDEQRATETLLEAKGELWAEVALPPAEDKLDLAVTQARATVNMLYLERRLALEEQRPAYHAQIEQAVQHFIAINRRHARERGRLPLSSVSDIQAALSSKDVLVDYLISDRALMACVFCFQHPPRWIRLGSANDIIDQINRFHNITTDLHHSTSEIDRKASAPGLQRQADQILGALYDQLIAPLAALLPESGFVAIAPDGPLFAVPWPSLVGPKGYFGAIYEITLLPSAANYAMPIAPDMQQPGHPVALGYGGDPSDIDLPAVEDELKAIKAVLPMLQIHYPARRQDVNWTMAPQILHIATHGSLSERVPLLSHLELADGPLLLADAMNLNLHGTTLVTLSACVSATLPTQGGLVLTLAGAFLCAGAQAALASLWPVDDRATQLFMERFYEAVSRGGTLSNALQQAQATLRDMGYGHPYYWGAFQLFRRSHPNREKSTDLSNTE